MPARPSAPVLRGSRRGPPRVRGWAMGGGAVGGGAGPPGRIAGPWGRARPTRVLPVGVARRRRWRRRAAVALCALGSSAVPPPRVRGAWCHPGAAGRIAIGRLVVETPSLHRPFVAVLGGGRGGLPGGRCRGGGHGRGIVSRSVRRPACRQSAGRARSPASPPRSARRAPPRAPCAPAAKCVWGSLPRAQSPTHTAVRRLARRAAAAPRWASPRT